MSAEWKDPDPDSDIKEIQKKYLEMVTHHLEQEAKEKEERKRIIEEEIRRPLESKLLQAYRPPAPAEIASKGLWAWECVEKTFKGKVVPDAVKSHMFGIFFSSRCDDEVGEASA